MAIKELPKDEYSKSLEAKGLDVCPVKLTGLDWFRHKILLRFGKFRSLDEIDEQPAAEAPMRSEQRI